jgi:signal transduction histidine kinase
VRLVRQNGSVRDMMYQWRPRSGETRQFVMSFERIEIDGQPCVLTTHVDVTERQRVLVLEERQRISADLHDSTVQSLYAEVLRLAAAERLLERVRDADSADSAGCADRADSSDVLTELQSQLSEAKRSLLKTIQTTRAIVDGLTSDRVAEHGFRQALTTIGDELERGTGARVRVTIAAETEDVLDSELAGELLLLAREAASNVARHAEASAVSFLVAADERGIDLIIRDNGRGFTAPDVSAARVGAAHYGLRSMAKRAEHLGGHLDVESARGQGTVVRVHVPLSRPTGTPSPTAVAGNLPSRT